MDPAQVLADPGVTASSLTHALPYWAVVHGAMLLRDGSYELGFELQPLHLDTLSEEELDGVARRLKRFIETLPARERARFVYHKDADVEKVIAQQEMLISTQSGSAAYLARRRIAALRDAAGRGQFVNRRLLLSLTYHPGRTRPPRRWATVAIVAMGTVLAFGILSRWMVGLVAGAALAGLSLWIGPVHSRKAFAPLTSPELEEDGAALQTLRKIILSALDTAGVSARPLTDNEYVDWAWRYFNPGRAATGLRSPSLNHQTRTELPPWFTKPDCRFWLGGGEWTADVSLRQMIARSSVVRDPSTLLVDNRHIKIVAMDALPVGESRMNELVKLLANRTKGTVIVDVSREPRAAALARLALRSRLLHSIVESQGVPDTVAAERGLRVTHEVQYQAVGGEMEIVRFGVAAILVGETADAAADSEREVLEFFNGELQDAQIVREDGALARQFFNLAPFSGRINGRTRAALSITAVHFLPVAGPPPGSSRPVLLASNRYHGLTAIDPFDPRQHAWNAVAAGSTGSGKTFFSAILAMATHAAGTRIVIVDRGSNTPPGPWLSATRLLGGQHISMDPATGAAVNPCDVDRSDAEPDANKVTFLVTLISRMVSTAGAPLDGYERGVVEAAVRTAYARGVRAAMSEGQRHSGGGVQLHDIVQSLRMLGAVAGTHQVSDDDRQTAQRIASRLYQWVDHGRFAGLVDRSTTVNLTRDWIYIDVAALESNPELMPVMILILTDLIWRHVSRDLGTTRTLVVLDEVWALIADPVAGAFVEDLYRRFRTTGSGVLSISQDIRDFQNNDHALAVLANSNAYFLFRTESPAACGQVLRLNSREVEANLARMSTATGEYAELMRVQRLQSRSASGLVALFPSPSDYWLVASHAQERVLRDQYISAHADPLQALEALVRDHPTTSPLPLAGAHKEDVRA
jgi:TraG P-loop domain/TraC protein